MYSYSISPNSITKYYSKSFEDRLNGGVRPKKVPPKNIRKVNELSRTAQKRLKNSCNWLVYLSKKRNVMRKDGGITYNFKSAFVTLKLPSMQKHSHAEIIKKSLNYFLVQMRRSYGLKNYVWKAEIQKNGNIHFHLLIDQFIDYMAVRNMWNKAIQILGYVTAYRDVRKSMTFQEYQYWRNVEGFYDVEKIRKAYEYGCKTDWKSPNSTDVKLVRNPDVVSSYISKYIAKNECQEGETGLKADSRKELTGRLWYCSTSLSRIKNIVVKESSRFNQLFKTILNSAKTFVVDSEYCVKLYFKTEDFGVNFREFLKKMFLSNAFRSSYTFPKEFHQSYYYCKEF